MKLKFKIEKNPFYLLDYYYCNNAKVKIYNGFEIEETEDNLNFFIQSSYLKSSKIEIKSDGNYTIYIKNLISKELYILILLCFFILLFFTSYFNNDFIWNLTTSFCLIVFSSLVFLFSVGQKYFFKIYIHKEND